LIPETSSLLTHPSSGESGANSLLGKSHRCPWGILPTSARPNRGAKRYLSAALFPSHTVIFNNGGWPPSITKCDGRLLKKRDNAGPRKYRIFQI
jgi:hypothetical protein